MRLLGMEVGLRGLRSRVIALNMLVGLIGLVMNLPIDNQMDFQNALLWMLVMFASVLCVAAEVKAENLGVDLVEVPREPTPEMAAAYLDVAVAMEKMDGVALGNEGTADILAANPVRWCRPIWRAMLAAAQK